MHVRSLPSNLVDLALWLTTWHMRSHTSYRLTTIASDRTTFLADHRNSCEEVDIEVLKDKCMYTRK